VSEINAKKNPSLACFMVYFVVCTIFLAREVSGIKICVLMQCFSLSMFCANVLHQDRDFDSRTSLAGNVALTIGIASSTQKRGLFFRFIADTKSKRDFFFKPCIKTSQFSTGLHSQAHKRCQTALVRGV
jgi:cytosine/uracil/thiamine/allantoin permease